MDNVPFRPIVCASISSRPRRPDTRPPVVPGGVKVRFAGGPWAGQTKVYCRNPCTIGCVTDASAVGMHGVYKTPQPTWTRAESTLTATWQELPRKR